MKYQALLDGLEIYEVYYSKLSNVIDFRIESEYFEKRFIDLENALSKIETTSFTNIAKVNNGQAYQSEFFNLEEGVRISKIGDVTNKREIDNWEFVSDEEFKNQKGKYLKHGDILMTLTGDPPDVGKVNYVNHPKKATWNQRVAQIQLIDKSIIMSNEVLFAILSTEYSRQQLERYAKGIRQRNLGSESLERLRIPNLSIDVQNSIQQLIEQYFKDKEIAKQKYTQAETLLLENLGLQNFQATCEPVNIKLLKESFLQTGRLDAEYYQPLYEQLEQFIKDQSTGFEKLGKLCTLHDGNYTPKEDQEYDYIELSNIGKSGEITGSTKALGKDLPSRARRKVRSNQVIISSIEGSLQSCAIVPTQFDNALCSTGFYVLSSDVMNAETLLVLFKSSLMQQILKKNCSGTILTAINKEELLNIPLPIISQNIQEKIAEYVRQSNDLRQQAQDLLAQAKNNVEWEIENHNCIENNQQGGVNESNYQILLEKSAYFAYLAEWTLLESLLLAQKVNVSIQSFSESFGTSGRFDAEYYQPKFARLFKQLANFKTMKLGEIVNLQKSIEPGSEAYQTDGIPFVRVSDLSKFGISQTDKFLNPADFTETIRPKKDSILLTKDGTVGIAYRVPQDLNVITSGAIVHLELKTDDILPDYLTLVLNSKAVQLQAERDAGGSIIQHWKPSEILDVVIPVLPKNIQQTISDKVQQSFALKAESEALLIQAKMKVDQEIETMR